MYFVLDMYILYEYIFYMSEITISHIPPIKSGLAAVQTSKAYPFNALQETQSLIIPADQSEMFPRIRSAASYYARKHGIFLRCYAMEDGGLQVYRDLDTAGKKGGGRVASDAPAKPLRGTVPPLPSSTMQSVPALPSQRELPLIPSTVTPVGPTQQAWCDMLDKMQPQQHITIPSTYKIYYNSMIAWSREFANESYRNYAVLVVGSELHITRGEDPVYDVDMPDDLAAIDAQLENTPLDVITISPEGQQLTAERESASKSPNNDGWTNLPCVACAGNPQGCVYCSGTGKFYNATLDYRVTPPIVPTPDPTDTAKTLDTLHRQLERDATMNGYVEYKQHNGTMVAVSSRSDENYDVR